MTTLRKFGLPLLALALLAFVLFDKCKPTVNPCNDCTTVTPAFKKTANGLIVQPPALPDITGTIMTVKNLADNTVFIVDTIEPGGFRLIPVNVDSTGINVQLEYLTPAPLPERNNGKYCKTSTDFPTTLGIIIMDVVMDHTSNMGGKGDLCELSCSGTWYQEPGSPIYTLTIPYGEYEPGKVKFFTVVNNGVNLKFFIEFFADQGETKMRLYECLGSGWATSWVTSPEPHIVCSLATQSFSISNSRDDGPSPLYISINATSMTSNINVNVCAPMPR